LAPAAQSHMRMQHDLLTQLSQVVLPLRKAEPSWGGHHDDGTEEADSSMVGGDGEVRLYIIFMSVYLCM